MPVLSIQFHDSSAFSLLGDTFAARLGAWSKIPEGELLVDAKIDTTPVQMFARMKYGGLYFTGEWQEVNTA